MKTATIFTALLVASCRAAPAPSPTPPAPLHGPIGLPTGAAQPIQVTDTTGLKSASVIDAGGVAVLVVVP